METPKFIIELTTQTNRRFYLHTMRPDRITKTRYANNARSFADHYEAQDFLNNNAGHFGYKWKVVAK